MHKFKPYTIFYIYENKMSISTLEYTEFLDIKNLDEALEIISTHIDALIVQRSI